MAKLRVSEPVKGSISLVGGRVCRSREELPPGTATGGSPPHPNELFIVSSGRTLHICGPSRADMDAWAAFSERAIAGHSTHEGAKVPIAAEGMSVTELASGGPVRGPEATLAAAAAGGFRVREMDEPIEVAAWLHKAAPDGRRWERRYATLQPESLLFAYFVGPGPDDRCCRVIDLRAATVLPGLVDPTDRSADPTLRSTSGFRIMDHGSVADGSDDTGRVLLFVTPSEQEAQVWVEAIFTAQVAGNAGAGTTIQHKGDSAPASSGSSSGSLRASLPLLQVTVHKSNPRGGGWTKRLLVIAPHERYVDALPGVAPSQFPCLAYYTGEDKTPPPKGVIPLETVTGVVLSAPEAVRHRAPGAYTLTINTADRDYYMSATSEVDLVKIRDAIHAVAAAWNEEAG
jgi:hypothetical protein